MRSQEITLQNVSGRALADLALSGEVPLSPTIRRDHALEMQAKGAPIDWVLMEVVPTNAVVGVIVTQAPHSHPAVLLTDFARTRSGEDFGRPRLRHRLRSG